MRYKSIARKIIIALLFVVIYRTISSRFNKEPSFKVMKPPIRDSFMLNGLSHFTPQDTVTVKWMKQKPIKVVTVIHDTIYIPDKDNEINLIGDTTMEIFYSLPDSIFNIDIPDSLFTKK